MIKAVIPRVKWGTKLSLDVIEALRAAGYDRREDLSDVLEKLIREHLPPKYVAEGRARAERSLKSNET